MNLLDKVKQGMIESTKVIKEISSDMSEMTKLKMNLSREKGKLEELYYNLGKTIIHTEDLEKIPDGVPEAAILLFYEAKATLKNIREYEEKMEFLKGIIKCSQCGFIIDPDANYCSNCGNKLTSPPSAVEDREETPKVIEESCTLSKSVPSEEQAEEKLED
ncbi:zinc ribbon domain-containing protein [Thermotalea metallivorans]|uniref:Putative zinc-ribbon domain-containing protein n=1 Tax=Thermotalea metallivorans TaxID=520762 RepID=A0A140L7Q9_9FIRM|nr:zinc ribbon domain-containing protein [Thermotalea metallivorans]KXG76584.1 hypothetical protein AN619_09090 [Thermotalea metallivorans]